MMGYNCLVPTAAVNNEINTFSVRRAMHLHQPLLADVFQASQRIRETVLHTPIVKSSWLSDFSGSELFLKLENLQTTGSFKLRGATNKILSLAEIEKQRGVIAVSSGNHGRAGMLPSRHRGSCRWFAGH